MADHRNMPFPPRCDLGAMTIGDLAILLDLFEAMSSAAVGILNQPTCSGAASQYVDMYWDHHILGMSDAIITEIESRAPVGDDEATVRARALLRHLSLGDDFEKMRAIAASATTAFSADLGGQG